MTKRRKHKTIRPRLTPKAPVPTAPTEESSFTNNSTGAIQEQRNPSQANSSIADQTKQAPSFHNLQAQNHSQRLAAQYGRSLKIPDCSRTYVEPSATQNNKKFVQKNQTFSQQNQALLEEQLANTENTKDADTETHGQKPQIPLPPIDGLSVDPCSEVKAKRMGTRCFNYICSFFKLYSSVDDSSVYVSFTSLKEEKTTTLYSNRRGQTIEIRKRELLNYTIQCLKSLLAVEEGAKMQTEDLWNKISQWVKSFEILTDEEEDTNVQPGVYEDSGYNYT